MDQKTTNQDATKKHGVFSWNELMTTDVKSAQAFYGEMYGAFFERRPHVVK
jgi:predicted enzyme related to lactoylglutathione lyase